MMQAAQDWLSSDLAEPLNGTTERRVLAQRQMWPDFVVIVGIGSKEPARMGLAKEDDVIEAFPADRADQSLRMPVLPRGPRGRRVISNGCAERSSTSPTVLARP